MTSFGMLLCCLLCLERWCGFGSALPNNRKVFMEMHVHSVQTDSLTAAVKVQLHTGSTLIIFYYIICLLPLPHKQTTRLHFEPWEEKQESVIRTSAWMKVRQQLLDWAHSTDCHPTSVYHFDNHMSVYIHECNWAIFPRAAVTHTKL